METLSIIPYIAVGKIKFGSSRNDIEKMLGKAVKETKTYFGDLRLEYDGFGIVFEKDEVAEVNFLPSINLLYKDHKLFKNKNIISLLKNLDPNMRKEDETLIFPKLGIALSNFELPDQTPVVTVFKEGYWDDI